ncbi:hypothetical protein [Butyrivibrio sp. AE3006]|uniref:hypothetical protein n=1 Tax=Butyrivibrio sp. AE3006 TaxID=1280673 RepID=UPI0004079135|nr:hypothetical protein [Butyrivibrio sp. AE3006]
MSVESLLQYAFDRFDENNYDEAVKAFIAAHIASEDIGQKADIFEVVYENFIKPNEEEFKNAFSENMKILIERGILKKEDVPDFDNNSLLMVPVSDTTYYVWSKPENKFYSGQHYDFTVEDTSDVYRSIDSIIIDGFSNLKMILDVTTKERFKHEYIVLDDADSRNGFFSFFMIPGVAQQLDDAVMIFLDRQELIDYLYETGNYIPRTIKSASGYDYAEDMSGLHKKRISEEKKNKPLVAITIPTFNRGKIALENVKRLQGLLYDEEVEFIICNNSSKEESEYYEEIEKLSHTDSRIKYCVKSSECFRDSLINVLEFDDAEFSLFCSDEDYLIHENFGYVLEVINKNRDQGVICFGVVGVGYYLDKELYQVPGVNGLQSGFGCTYLTGICLKPDDVRKDKLIEKFSKYKENIYYVYYTHCVYTAYLGHKSGIYTPNIPCFYDSVGDVLHNKEREKLTTPPEHVTLDNRLEQTKALIEILIGMNLTIEEILNGILSTFLNLYMRVRIAYGYYYQEMEKLYTWDAACDKINDLYRKLADELEERGVLSEDDVLLLTLHYNKSIEKEMANRPVDYRNIVKIEE